LIYHGTYIVTYQGTYIVVTKGGLVFYRCTRSDSFY